MTQQTQTKKASASQNRAEVIHCEIRDEFGDVESAGTVLTPAEAYRWYEDHGANFDCVKIEGGSFTFRRPTETNYASGKPELPQHSPLPWEVAEYGIRELKAKYLCIKHGSKTIARIDASGNSLSVTKQDEANARLIVASVNNAAKVAAELARERENAEKAATRAEQAQIQLAAELEKRLWQCPTCGFVMTEEQSKGYRGCPTGMHFVQHQQANPDTINAVNSVRGVGGTPK
jgi:hypothetical protein